MGKYIQKVHLYYILNISVVSFERIKQIKTSSSKSRRKTEMIGAFHKSVFIQRVYDDIIVFLKDNRKWEILYPKIINLSKRQNLYAKTF